MLWNEEVEKEKRKNEDRKNSGDTFVEDCALKMRLV